MTDPEKIAAILADKHLNNVQFCQRIHIPPSSLSHIFSGRSKPTLTLLRAIANGFPDINPLWLFTGQGEMYGAPTHSPTRSGEDDLGASLPLDDDDGQTHSAPPTEEQGGAPAHAGDDGQVPIPWDETGDEQPMIYPQGERGQEGLNGQAAEKPGGTRQGEMRSAVKSGRDAQTGEGDVADLARKVAQVLAHEATVHPSSEAPQPTPRHIAEIRVFFDDRTYEVFTP